jgi:deazaflavin-dependent oxidoreductase (nitroreductase family)
MAKYIPSPRDWVREQVELYESSGGTKGTTLQDTGLPVVIVTHRGNKTGAIRKTPLMRVREGDNYILFGSQGGAPKDPVWVHNLRADPHSSFAMRQSYARCACVRSRTRRKGAVCGRWPWRHTHHTRNIKRARNVKFRSSLPSPSRPLTRGAARRTVGRAVAISADDTERGGRRRFWRFKPLPGSSASRISAT